MSDTKKPGYSRILPAGLSTIILRTIPIPELTNFYSLLLSFLWCPLETSFEWIYCSLDRVDLYLDPPDRALVIYCDEKTRCQALERTQPGLPLNVGHIKTKSHDYYRHGITTLFAALNYLDGTLIFTTQKKHRNEEWIKFLKQIEKETPEGLDLHLIIDNYSAHKHQNVKDWLKKHPRFNMHYTPTGSSWMNLKDMNLGSFIIFSFRFLILVV